MFVLERSKAERVVLLLVLVIADTHACSLQQVDHGCKHFVARHTGQLLILVDSFADVTQSLAKGEHAPEFRLIPNVAVGGVVSVLFTSPRVAANRLDVSVRRGADPYIGPRGRNDEPSNPLERRFVLY